MDSVNRYFTNIGKGFWTIMLGMKVTMKHLFTPAVTIQYPDERMPIPERGRNRLYVNMDDCIGCNQCGMACPVDCITIETAKSLPTEDLGVTSTGQKKRLWVTKFDIDFGKCCYCGLCVPPCPTECIYMTDVFEFSEYDRNRLNYSFITLTPEEVASKVAQAKEAEKEAAAKKAAAAAAAAQKAAQTKAAQQSSGQTTAPSAHPETAGSQQPTGPKPESVARPGSEAPKAQTASATEPKQPSVSSDNQMQDPAKPKPEAPEKPLKPATEVTSQPKIAEERTSPESTDEQKSTENGSGSQNNINRNSSSD